ncbi:sugar ABC transporter [Nocardioides psychrotolerans]|uniref:Ribose transport system ATP-binding protein n=1 Tax=Nocardioides psychrotolerans TaxID=1005945 RepID=A0A1I3HMA7_9ACTN|nr:sugar ABC transporter ATP-binding protein [Nocardioides psychrotolerans]GEP40026.1 sugar ABC transporter [Nocardioides psychrotolerans]SFI36739.1 ribose transport system ATP-binding protein [Nocardioides psychrotolerans]
MVEHPTDEGLVCRGLVKTYSGVSVLKSVDFHVRPGTVVGLIGENGAGKSTLSSVITGVVQRDGGEMLLDGRPYEPGSPSEALHAGVVLIHQEIRLLPDLSVAENIYLGRLPSRGGRIDRSRMHRDAAEVLGLLGVDLDPRRPVRGLSMARQQEIEIAKALSRNPAYVIFDEPSASLGETETEHVLERIQNLRSLNTGVVYISHRLDEVLEVSDEIVCLRDGARVAHWPSGDVARTELVNAMVGREFTYEHVAPQPSRADTVLEVRGLSSRGKFTDIDFTVAAGEVLGIAGLVGAGRTEVVRAIAGVDRPDTGEVLVDGQRLRPGSPQCAIKAGVVMVPEDRKGQGLNLNRTAAENLALPWEKSLSKLGMVTRRTIARLAAEQRERLDIRGDMHLPVKSMSGGNQQKVLIGKWLVRDPRVLIVDEPTRGVDVGAKMAIYEIIRGLAAQGLAVIVVSSELEEVLGLSHRVVVLARGQQQGVLTREEATPQRVMELAFAGSGDGPLPSEQPSAPLLQSADATSGV